MKKYDIIAIGECLVDFVCSCHDGKLQMEGNPGGAPANVLAAAARLGHSTAMISKVGSDNFGAFLQEHLVAAGVEDTYIVHDDSHPTTLAIVQLDEGGNRSFGFYRDRTADVMLCKEELPVQALQNTKILHFGSLSLTDEPARSATFVAIEIAKMAGAVISYDPNLRPLLWQDMQQAYQLLHKGMSCADVIKVSEEEVQFLSGESDIEAGTRKLYHDYPVRLLAVTRGPLGCLYCVDGKIYTASTYDTICIDTTGAGDASWGAALSWLLEREAVEQLADDEVQSLMNFANAAGSLATTKYGGITAMPSRQEILHCISTVPKLVPPGIEQ